MERLSRCTEARKLYSQNIRWRGGASALESGSPHSGYRDYVNRFVYPEDNGREVVIMGAYPELENELPTVYRTGSGDQYRIKSCDENEMNAVYSDLKRPVREQRGPLTAFISFLGGISVVDKYLSEERKLYTVLTDEEIGDGDTYILNDFMEDGWKLYCDTQHTADQAHAFMRRYTTRYTAAEYRVQPITFKAACAFIKHYHRHHMPPQGHMFSISLWAGDILAGVVMVGRPVSRYRDDGKTVEILRMCVKPGYRNGCSLLYARAARAAREMGYARMITYTLEEKSGSSLRAVGFQEKGISSGGS